LTRGRRKKSSAMTKMDCRNDGNRHLGDRCHFVQRAGRSRIGSKIADDPVRLMSAATFEPLLFKGDDFTKTDVKVCL
jgi:hypothetical protein